MPWVKLDVAFPDHPKVLEAGPAAAWLYVAGLCYCGKYLTDGFIPDAAVPRLCDGIKTKSQANRLQTAGLWRKVEGGWFVNDYDSHQRTKSQVEADKAKTRERVQRHRNGVRNGVTNAPVTPLDTDTDTDTSLTRSRRKPETAAPKDFPITAEMREWAASKGIRTGLERETERFLDWHRSEDKRRRDWVAAWRNWITRAADRDPKMKIAAVDPSDPYAGQVFR